MPIYRDPSLGRLPDQTPSRKPSMRAATTMERITGKIDETVGPALRALQRFTGMDTPEGQLEATFPTPAAPVAAMAKSTGQRLLQPAFDEIIEFGRAQGGKALEALKNRAPGIIKSRGDKPLDVVIAMEQSGTEREAFRRLGHNAISIDRMPDHTGSPNHIQGDVFETLDSGQCGPIDILMGHPTCQYLAGSGLHWNNRGRGWEKTEQAIKDYVRLYETPSAKNVALENPVGILSSRFRKPDFFLSPHQVGADASKKTGYHLRGDLEPPPLDPSMQHPGRLLIDPRTGKEVRRYSNQTASGQNNLGPSPDRWIKRSITPPEVANFLAEQFSEQVLRKRGR